MSSPQTRNKRKTKKQSFTQNPIWNNHFLINSPLSCEKRVWTDECEQEMLSSLLQWLSAKTAQVGHSSRHPATVSTSRHSWEELCRGACGDPPHSQSNHHLSKKWRESLRLHSTMYLGFHSDSTFVLSISWILCVTAFVQWVGGFFKS